MRPLLAAMLLLAGCGSTTGPSVSAEDAADEAAQAQKDVADLSDEVSDLKERVRVEEVNSNTLFQRESEMSQTDETQDKNIKTLFENDRKFADRTGLPMEK